jgi:hypothetical protein
MIVSVRVLIVEDESDTATALVRASPPMGSGSIAA